MIELSGIDKSFKVAKRKSGMKAALQSFMHKNYDEIHALNEISFKIDDGEIVGYIGPNGAGKSSTIKIMSGILVPDHGECRINGLTPWKQRRQHAKQIGVVFGQRSQLWWDLPVIDSFELLKDIYDIEPNTYQARLDELRELLHLEEILLTPTRQLSLGQRMRCEIAASLIHNPKVLFLDEPTIGLDASSKLAVRSFIKKINALYHTTVILTTHDMQDIESLCTRVIMIGKGKILYDGSLQAMRHRYQNIKLIQVHGKGNLLPTPGLQIISHEDEDYSLLLDLTKGNMKEAVLQITTQLDVTDLSIEDEAIDQVVLSLYQEFRV